MTTNNPFNEPPKLIQPGMTAGVVGDFTEYQVKLREAKFQAKSLTELVDEYAFYTPALIYLSMPFSSDPIHVFMMEYGKEVSPTSFRFESRIFSGLTHNSGDVSWNHVLFAMEREHFEHYRNWMGTVALNDPANQQLYRVRWMEFAIPDPMALANAVLAKPPRLDITAFCVETNVGSWAYEVDPLPSLRSPTRPPTALANPPNACFDKMWQWGDTQAFIDAVVEGNTNPYKEVDKVHNKELTDATEIDPPISDGSGD